MGKIIDLKNTTHRSKYRYAVYKHKLITNDGMTYVRSFIVIKNQYDVIIRFTKLHNFTGVYDNKVFRPLASDANARMHYICKMLNYILIENYKVYHIDHIFKITKEMLTSFFMDYALEKKPNGEYRSCESIENCVYSVTNFFNRLIYKYGGFVTLKKSDLFIEKEVYGRNGRLTRKRIPDFQIRGVSEERKIFRDLPTKVFRILMNLAVRYTPEISFAMGLQAFAGLRPGEVCNVRQEVSPKGSGIIFTYLDGKIVRADIDLTHEYAMRSDGIQCGKIKKERTQSVYPPFLEAFQTLYEYHKIFLASQNFEKDYCPMFVNARGMAMTYDHYRKKFQNLVEMRLRPVLLEHSDPECRIYGQLLCENRLGPHALRHWFSVQLALRGENVAQLQFWRGDKRPESAFDYLQNKGDLIRELANANDLLAEILMEKGSEYYGRN